VVLVRLGRVPYGPVLELQRRLHSLRREGKIPDLLLSLEHEPVITLGRDGRNDHLLLPQDELRRMGVEIYAVERGGAATYHGPGQLVLYPVLDLRELGLGVREYVRQLEEVMIRTGKALGVELFRRPGYPGAWHRKGKSGSSGSTCAAGSPSMVLPECGSKAQMVSLGLFPAARPAFPWYPWPSFCRMVVPCRRSNALRIRSFPRCSGWSLWKALLRRCGRG
jgi:hypothetical protein